MWKTAFEQLALRIAHPIPYCARYKRLEAHPQCAVNTDALLQPAVRTDQQSGSNLDTPNAQTLLGQLGTHFGLAIIPPHSHIGPPQSLRVTTRPLMRTLPTQQCL